MKIATLNHLSRNQLRQYVAYITPKLIWRYDVDQKIYYKLTLGNLRIYSEELGIENIINRVASLIIV
jgi:hypothetical protein